MLVSGIKPFYIEKYNFIFEDCDETEISLIKRNRANCKLPKVSELLVLGNIP